MKLRALTLSKKIVYFGLEEAPVSINERQTILCNQPMSPILLSDTIARVSDDKVVAEFDFVCNKEDCRFVGYVVYIDGFYIWNPKTGSLTPIRNTSEYRFIENLNAYRVRELNELRSSIRFKCKYRLFRLKKIMHSDGANLYIEIKGSFGPVPITETDMCTGIGSDRKELQFGKYLEDGVVVLHDYHPMVKLRDGTFREVESKDYE